MQSNDRLSRRDGDESFGELKVIARPGIAIYFYADGTKFEFGTFASNTLVIGFAYTIKIRALAKLGEAIKAAQDAGCLRR